jgi:hypothetical protein
MGPVAQGLPRESATARARGDALSLAKQPAKRAGLPFIVQISFINHKTKLLAPCR